MERSIKILEGGRFTERFKEHYSDYGSYPLYRVKGTDAVSPFVGELAKKLGSVTIDKNAIENILSYDKVVGTRSVFEEIEWLNPLDQLNPRYKKMALERIIKPISWWADRQIEILEKWFLQHYDQHDSYWVLQSGGYDSRIVTSMLARLRKKIVIKNILFVCWFPEAETAYEVLKYEGWPENQIWLVNSERTKNPGRYWDMDNYYDFDMLGFLTNGEIAPFGALQSIFWKPFYSEEDVGKTTIMNSNMGDVVIGPNSWRMIKQKYVRDEKYENYSQGKHKELGILIAEGPRRNNLGILPQFYYFKKVLVPTMSFDYVENGICVPGIYRYRDRMRRTILEKLCPGITNIPRKHEFWLPDIMKECPDIDYKHSEFYGKYMVDEYIDWRGISVPKLFSFSSLYDHLIKNRVKIKGSIF